MRRPNRSPASSRDSDSDNRPGRQVAPYPGTCDAERLAAFAELVKRFGPGGLHKIGHEEVARPQLDTLGIFWLRRRSAIEFGAAHRHDCEFLTG